MPLGLRRHGHCAESWPGNLLDEAKRLTAVVLDRRIRARQLGGAGIAMHAHAPIPDPLRRDYRDLDYVVSRRKCHGVERPTSGSRIRA